MTIIVATSHFLGLNSVIYIKHWAQGLAYSKHSIYVNHYVFLSLPFIDVTSMIIFYCCTYISIPKAKVLLYSHPWCLKYWTWVYTGPKKYFISIYYIIYIYIRINKPHCHCHVFWRYICIFFLFSWKRSRPLDIYSFQMKTIFEKDNILERTGMNF